jgi:hypothetical protein
VVVVLRLLATLTLIAGGCAHRVRIDSNVPEATVRVDGVELGRIADGPSFVERWGFRTSYDVEVRAPGYAIARRRLEPTVVDPAIGVPALLGCGCGGLGGCCVLPAVGLVAGPATFAGAAALAASSVLVGASAGACAVGFGASERLPDVVTIALDPEAAAGGDDDLPPPPVDDDEPGPVAQRW